MLPNADKKWRFDVKKLNIAFSLLAVLAMVAAWIAVYYTVRNDYVIPSFTDTLREMGAQLASADFWVAFGNTLGRSAGAWLLAFALAAVFAALSALAEPFRRFFAPVVGVLRTVPTMAITLMLLVWTTPRIAPIIVAFLMIFPLTYAQMLAAYGGIDPKLIEMARVYRIPKREQVLRIVLPLMLPQVLAQAGANLSLTLKVMVSAEVLASTFRSVGGLLHEAAAYAQMAQMFAVVILMLLVGGILEFALGFLGRIGDRWTRGRSKEKA